MKRVAIIGGGWVGCHLAMVLRDQAEVVLYEKNHTLISETSFVNQNRLHYGYHYARNAATRRLCATTFVRFMEDYGNLVHDVSNNYYAVSEDESLLDAETISIIFGKGPHNLLDSQAFGHTSLLLNTPEKRIDAIGASLYFQWQLESLVKKEAIQRSNLQALKKDYDFVFDCTNNSLLEPLPSQFFEAVAMFIYRPKKPLPFGALTYIDGELFSIYPYNETCFSLSHVKHGIMSDKSLDNADNARRLIEEHVERYWPDFSDSFDYLFPTLSIKAKVKDSSAKRTPLMRQEDNLFSFFTGKIQGIYAIEQMVKQIIAQP
jgi:hypothetical protein